jgi:hypothetical protein
MTDSSDTVGNRTRDLPVCSTVSKPTALPRIASRCGECEDLMEHGVEPRPRAVVLSC